MLQARKYILKPHLKGNVKIILSVGITQDSQVRTTSYEFIKRNSHVSVGSRTLPSLGGITNNALSPKTIGSEKTFPFKPKPDNLTQCMFFSHTKCAFDRLCCY